jgi:SAM-dependent methyltransferase
MASELNYWQERRLANYWQERGIASYKYRGETFYTIVPVPYYFRRRKLLLSHMNRIVSNTSCERICDFGCGDGFYLKTLAEHHPGKNWTGVDISTTMLERSRARFPNAAYFKDLSGFENSNFDLVYCIAVFAHIIDDSALEKVIRSICMSVNRNGGVVVFEQTGPIVYGRDFFKRRPYQHYIDAFEKNGLKLDDNKLFFFSLHVLFERYLAKLWYRFIAKGANETEKRFNANRSRVFRFISWVFTTMSIKPIRPPDANRWGYSMLVFKRHIRWE